MKMSQPISEISLYNHIKLLGKNKVTGINELRDKLFRN